MISLTLHLKNPPSVLSMFCSNFCPNPVEGAMLTLGGNNAVYFPLLSVRVSSRMSWEEIRR